jgi:hypothetical protein
VLFGLGIAEWATIIALVGGLILTFWVMAKASVAYERKRLEREARSADSQNEGEALPTGSQNKVESGGHPEVRGENVRKEDRS